MHSQTLLTNARIAKAATAGSTEALEAAVEPAYGFRRAQLSCSWPRPGRLLLLKLVSQQTGWGAPDQISVEGGALFGCQGHTGFRCAQTSGSWPLLDDRQVLGLKKHHLKAVHVNSEIPTKASSCRRWELRKCRSTKDRPERTISQVNQRMESVLSKW